MVLTHEQVPHETFKAAAHLVVNGKTRRFSRLELIFAHMGGSTLPLMSRVAGLSTYMGAPLSEEEILSEFRRYWWDAALSGSCATRIAESWGFGDRILWGSDFPGASSSGDIIWIADWAPKAVSVDTIRWFDCDLEKAYKTDPSNLENVYRRNVLQLFDSHGIKLSLGN